MTSTEEDSHHSGDLKTPSQVTMSLRDPPPYSLFKLQPTLPDADVRYGCQQRSVYRPRTIPVGSHIEREAVPTPWEEVIHPEGLPYFHNQVHRIVTDVDIRSPSNLQAVNYSANIILAKLADLKVASAELVSTELELYLRIDENNVNCLYYFVDHKEQTVFWLRDVESSELGLPPTASHQTLAYLLKAQYWTHIEWFGMHVVLSEDIVQDTIGILKFGLVDVRTSSESTFPYGEAETQGLVGVLDGFSQTLVVRGYKNWVIARVREVIESTRGINLHGEQNAKVSRLQSRYPDDLKTKMPVPSFILKWMFFAKPQDIHGQLQNLWIDKTSYTRSWRAFAQSTIAGFNQNISQSLIMVLVSAVFLAISWIGNSEVAPIRNASLALNATSIILASASSISATRLKAAYSKLTELAAESAGNYLENEFHETYGFYPLAIRLSFPSVLLLWALIPSATSAALCFGNMLYLAWDSTVWSYVLVLPIIISAIPAVFFIVILPFLRFCRAAKRRLTRIALPLNSSDL